MKRVILFGLISNILSFAPGNGGCVVSNIPQNRQPDNLGKIILTNDYNTGLNSKIQKIASYKNNQNLKSYQTNQSQFNQSKTKSSISQRKQINNQKVKTKDIKQEKQSQKPVYQKQYTNQKDLYNPVGYKTNLYGKIRYPDQIYRRLDNEDIYMINKYVQNTRDMGLPFGHGFEALVRNQPNKNYYQQRRPLNYYQSQQSELNNLKKNHNDDSQRIEREGCSSENYYKKNY